MARYRPSEIVDMLVTLRECDEFGRISSITSEMLFRDRVNNCIDVQEHPFEYVR